MAETKNPAFLVEDYEDFSLLVHQHGPDEAESRWGRRHSAEQAAALRAEYERAVENAQTGYPPRIIAGPRRGWYPGPLESDTFWPRLRAALEDDPGLSEDAVRMIDEASTKVLAYTHDPAASAWLTKGLVVGHVQSGKTTNYLSVVAKAVDRGYNLIIILSGIHNGLRAQTQERAETSLCELDRSGWVTQTTIDHDFRKPSQTLESLLPAQGQRKAVLCVVKKNHTVLKKLLAWITEAKRAGGLRRVKALIIDDEADQASVETARINPTLRDLLKLLPRRTFVGYTATPFANVLIDPTAGDLYPEHFILALPEPDGYFGPRMIFGRDAAPDRPDDTPEDGYDLVRPIPAAEALKLVPVRGRPFEPEITESLERALLWFWLATTARRIATTSGSPPHSTMLVHTSMRTDAHEALRDPIEKYRSGLLAGLEDADPDVIDQLAELWATEQGKVPAGTFGNADVPFDQVLRRLPAVVEDTRVVLDNSRSKDRLSYPPDDPVTVIAIGGNTLSRGLTLNGLIVSYFVRAARAYDTLLQMGRWFGFRPGYEHLCRIYMTDELQRWFRHLASVEHELRMEIERYDEQDMTPGDFGVRIRTHPQLAVTQKLGAARMAYTSYGGRRVQTRYFNTSDKAWLDHNLVATQGLVAGIESAGVEAEDVGGGSVLWRGVPHSLVLAFLAEYETHPDSPDLDRRLLTDYITTEIANGSLDRWSVAVVANPPGDDEDDEHTVTLGSRRFGTVVRSRLRGSSDPADIKTLMSKEDRAIDLNISRSKARGTSEEKLMQERTADPVHKTRALLVLYPIDRESEPDDSREQRKESREPLNAKQHVIGIGLVFPGNAKRSVQNSYIAVDTADLRPLEDPEDVEDLIEDDDEADEVLDPPPDGHRTG